MDPRPSVHSKEDTGYVVISSVEAKAELARRARLELDKRRTSPGFKESVVAALRGELFAQQLEVLDSPNKRIALCCSRRAGKSELAARMIVIELLRAKHNEFVVFAARTLMRARQVIWGLVAKINADYGLGFRMSEHIGQCVTPDGGVFMILGLDDSVAAEKLRGSKYRLAFLDEAATYETLLERTVIDCLEPGCIDTNGTIVIAGTPGYNRTGYWFKIASGQHGGWKNYFWTLRDNPHLPDVEAALKAIREGQGWSEDEPTYKREYLGQWAHDESTLVYAAAERRNTCRPEDLPSPPSGMTFERWVREEWLVTCGADIGYTEAFSVVILGSPPHSKDVYVLDCFTAEKLRAEEQANKIHDFRLKWRPRRTVIDAGGQGKLVHQEFNFRFGSAQGGPALPAKKQGKVEAIGMFNSDMRVGRIRAVLPAAAQVFKEWSELPWATDEKDLIHPAYDNHASDAVLYAWREHRAFLSKAAPEPKTEADLENERAEARLAAARKGRRR